MSSFIQAVSAAERQLELAVQLAEQQMANADEEARRREAEEAQRRALASTVVDLKQRLAAVKRMAAEYTLQHRCAEVHMCVKTAEGLEAEVAAWEVTAARVHRFEIAVVSAERMYWFMREVRLTGWLVGWLVD